MDRAEELTLKLMADGLTEAEIEELDRLVAADPEAARVHVGLLDLDAALRAAHAQGDVRAGVAARLQRTLAERVCRGVIADIEVLSARRGRRSSVLRWFRRPYLLAALAACSLVVIGWWALPDSSPRRASRPVVAALSGPVDARTPTGESVEIRVGAPLAADVTLRTTTAAGPLVLVYPNAEQIEVLPGSVVRQSSPGPVSRLVLSAGEIRVASGPGSVLEIETPHLDVRPATGRFRVAIDAASEGTRLTMETGSSTVLQRATGQTTGVAAGQYVLAGSGSDQLFVASSRIESAVEPRLVGREAGNVAGYAPDGRITLLRPRGVLVAGEKSGTFETLLDTKLVRSTGSIYSHITFGGVGEVSPAHRRLVGCAHDGVIWIWDSENRRQVGAVDTGKWLTQGCPVAAPADASWVATARPEVELGQRVRWWSLPDQTERAPLELAPARVRSLAASLDGKYLAVGVEIRQARERVLLHDGQSGEKLGAIADTPDTSVLPNLIRFCPTGKRLATVGLGGVVALWSVPDLRPLVRISHPGEPVALAYSLDGSLMAVASRAGDIVLYEVQRGAARYRIPAPAPRAISLSFSPDGKKLVANYHGDNAVLEWDLPALLSVAPGDF